MQARELGIRSHDHVCFINPPVGFTHRLGDLADGAVLVRPDAERFDLVVLFAKSSAIIDERLEWVRSRLDPRGTLWLGWPDDRAATDLSFNRVQAIGLAAGMVDNKIAELDERWNGIRFVVRVQNRPGWPNLDQIRSQYSNDRGSSSENGTTSVPPSDSRMTHATPNSDMR